MVSMTIIIELLVLLTYLSDTNASNISTDEAALLAFKAHITSDPNGMLSKNWTKGTHLCNWIGISCSRRHQRVTSLDLNGLRLRGSIATETGNLSFLSFLDIGNNSINGEIPDELSYLRRLKHLTLSMNNLTGQIPESLGLLRRLELLDLSENDLFGSVPSSIFNVSSLKVINLIYNALSGTLPNDICHNLPRLEGLQIARNQLSGQLPSNLDKCKELTYLSLSYNQFTGHIPSEIDNLSAIRRLSLRRNNLVGNLPPSIGNLSNLEMIDLGDNSLYGGVPQEFEHLVNLKEVYLGPNRLSGEVPRRMYNISGLKKISFVANELSGTLPPNIGHTLPNLEGLYLGENQFTGLIPTSIVNSTKLIQLDFGRNLFSGPVPMNLGKLQQLQFINFQVNQLRNDQSTGELSFLTSLSNCKYLKTVQIGGNQFNGSLPKSLGSGNWSFSLEYFIALQSGITGKIPTNISNFRNLEWLTLGDNKLIGSIPPVLGNLRNLKRFSLEKNNLDGIIPTSLCNMENLYQIILGKNQLTGELPSCFGNLSSLRELYLDSNALISHIPSTFWRNRDISILTLSSNLLNGSLAVEMRNSRSLRILHLHGNQFSGQIPSTIGQLQSLVSLSLSKNMLDGSIPELFEDLVSLEHLDLSSNNLSGMIPKSLRNLEHLMYFNVSFNGLMGEIPDGGPFVNFTAESFMGNPALCGSSRFHVMQCRVTSLERKRKSRVLTSVLASVSSGVVVTTIFIIWFLKCRKRSTELPLVDTFGQVHKRISYYDISQGTNNFDEANLIGRGSLGMIPKSLRNLEHLMYFNVSFNGLMGEIPDGGPFVNFTAESFMGNPALCGSSRFHVMQCRVTSLERKRKSRVLTSVLASVSSGVVVTTIFIIWFLKCRKRSTELPLVDTFGQVHKRISYYDISQGTNNFDEANLIGRGSLGLVYKGTLADRMVVAIKVFNTELQHAFRSFEVECQVLRSIRHRNLVKVISSCANFDYKVLVLEYMPNENLECWLHSTDKFLDITQRLKVMIDVASAVEYLHGGHLFVVVHCDLKPSNILLDEDMVAKVSDFGISKLLTAETLITHTKTLGTIGYMAPEYGSEGKVSTKGDVYSFGILLMETFTRKSPVDDLFVGDFTLKRWICQSLPDRLVDVVDINLFSLDEENFTSKERCFKSIMELALECTNDFPEERIRMEDITLQLKKILTQFLQNVVTN
ncbi:probable LRR receptor-like serine/threonine-protein kinase At3g47570 [Solanum stenotomum]|uniref:probable LRR receptor-like serine/threonine-protein kinase At3g47570 n=1 Tax=Solanum stenotomum TaxID=172797 RepID=UPI0020D08210|nr:probable LRR receptor-like serine/threonine-protein kinase At3g47570 [Solanum stenotomum]